MLVGSFWINKAREFAIVKHGYQKRKYTEELYWIHLEEVADMVPTLLKPIAWLHDVLEDTDTTIEELESEFGKQISDSVYWLSDLLKPEDGNREFRKAYYAANLKQASEEVQTVKLADLISNTSSIVLHDPGFARVYLKEKRELLNVLTRGDRGLWFVADAMVKLSERILQ